MSNEIPKPVRLAVYARADIDGWPVCEASIVLPTGGPCFGRAVNVHHRINRSVGGGYELSSLLALCGSGTTGCHGWIGHNRTLSEEFGWQLRSTDTPHLSRVLYRGRWAILTDDGQVHYQAETDPMAGEFRL